jgi:DNA-binding transcriptional ArsR family regulator
MLDTMHRFKAGIFKALAHPTRIAIVEILQQGEMTVSGLCEKIGIEQANASQHLAVLRNKNIVRTRKNSNQIFYSLSAPYLSKVLEAMRAFFLSHINEALEMLQGEKIEAKKVKVRTEAKK